MTCADRIAFADGQLPADQAAAFRDHLRTCAECRKQLPADMQLVSRLSEGPPARIDLREHREIAESATQGRWQWFGNTKTYDVYLATVDLGRVFVMDFHRWGMASAQPRFQVQLDGGRSGSGYMMSLGELGKNEHPLGPKFEVPYRRDFQGIGHPDPTHIAANDPATVIGLLNHIDELRAVVAGAADDYDSMQWSDQGDRCRALLERGPVR